MNIVILSGAGISAPSGIRTFRGKDGVWETSNPFEKDPENLKVFWDQLLLEIRNKEPNQGHLSLVTLEDKHSVTIITQNIDMLHEKAGSSRVIHLHGSEGEDLIMFGDQVENLDEAIDACLEADIFISIGTNDLVSPANKLITFAPLESEKIIINIEPTHSISWYDRKFIGCVVEQVPLLVEYISKKD